MTFPVKPTEQPRWATSAIDPDDIDEPLEGQKDSGWLDLQLPPHETMNWIQNRSFQWSDYLEKFADTIVANIDIDTGTDFIKLFTAGGGISLIANGNVGIGTDTPDFKLQIEDIDPEMHLKDISTGALAITQGMSGFWLTAGGMNSSSKYTPAIKFGSTDPDILTFTPKFLAGIIGRATESFNDTNSPMALDFLITPANAGASSIPTVAMILDQDGRLGIGIAPASILHTKPVSGDNVFNLDTPLNTDLISMVFRNGGGERFKLEVASSTEDVEFRSNVNDATKGFTFFNSFFSSSNPIIKLQNDGDVGIGTDTPLEKLHLDDGNMRVSALGATDPYLHFVPDSGTAQSWMVGIDDTLNNLTFAVGLPSSSNPFGTSADKFTINLSGQVGIGTGTPSARLHLTGGSQITSLLEDVTGGTPSLSQLMSGAGLMSAAMDATNKYTPALKFGSTDTAFTTRPVKFLAGLVGFATESYDANTDSGMGMEFLVTPDNAGADPTPTVAMILDQDSNLTINGDLIAENIGIGIASPTEELHIIGNILLDGSRPVLIPNSDNDGMTKQGSVGGWSFGLIGARGSGGTFLGGLGVLGNTDALTHWYIGTGANKRMIIEDNGDTTINGDLTINGLVGNVEISGELFVDDGMRFEASPSHLFKVKVLEIGSWNMAGGPISIAHSLAFDDIMAVRTIVRNDANTLKVPIMHSSPGATGDFISGVFEADSTNIVLTPVGTFFSAPDWNGTGFNRGFIIIWYIGLF